MFGAVCPEESPAFLGSRACVILEMEPRASPGAAQLHRARPCTELELLTLSSLSFRGGFGHWAVPWVEDRCHDWQRTRCIQLGMLAALDAMVLAGVLAGGLQGLLWVLVIIEGERAGKELCWRGCQTREKLAMEFQ